MPFAHCVQPTKLNYFSQRDLKMICPSYIIENDLGLTLAYIFKKYSWLPGRCLIFAEIVSCIHPCQLTNPSHRKVSSQHLRKRWGFTTVQERRRKTDSSCNWFCFVPLGHVLCHFHMACQITTFLIVTRLLNVVARIETRTKAREYVTQAVLREILHWLPALLRII